MIYHTEKKNNFKIIERVSKKKNSKCTYKMRMI